MTLEYLILLSVCKERQKTISMHKGGGHHILHAYIHVHAWCRLLIRVRFTEVLFYNISGMDGAACFSTERGSGKSTDVKRGAN